MVSGLFEHRNKGINTVIKEILNWTFKKVVKSVSLGEIQVKSQTTVKEAIQYKKMKAKNNSIVDNKARQRSIRNLTKNKETLKKKLDRLNSSFSNFSATKREVSRTALSSDRVRDSQKKSLFKANLEEKSILSKRMNEIDDQIKQLKAQGEPEKNTTFVSNSYLQHFERDKQNANSLVKSLSKCTSYEKLITPSNKNKLRDIRKKDLLKRQTYVQLLENIKIRDLSGKPKEKGIYYYQRIKQQQEAKKKKEKERQFNRYYQELKKRKEFYRPMSREELNKFEENYLQQREIMLREKESKLFDNDPYQPVTEVSQIEKEKIEIIKNSMKKQNYSNVVRDYFQPEIDECKRAEVRQRSLRKVERYTLSKKRSKPQLPKPGKVPKLNKKLKIPLHLPKISLIKDQNVQKKKEYQDYLKRRRAHSAKGSNRDWNKMLMDSSYSAGENRKLAMQQAKFLEEKAKNYIGWAKMTDDERRVDSLNTDANSCLIDSIKGKLAVLNSLAK